LRSKNIRKLLGLAAVLAVALVACGDAGSGTGVASLENVSSSAEVGAEVEGSADRDVETQMLAFAHCMRDAGVDMEDPRVDADGNLGFGAFRGPGQDGDQTGPPEGFREAIDQCQPLLEGLELGFGLGDQTELQDTLVEYAQCMRDNGYAMDDPDLSDFGPGAADDGGERIQGGGPFGDVDFDDPAFQTAQSACEDILGGFGPGRGARSGADAGQDS